MEDNRVIDLNRIRGEISDRVDDYTNSKTRYTGSSDVQDMIGFDVLERMRDMQKDVDSVKNKYDEIFKKYTAQEANKEQYDIKIRQELMHIQQNFSQGQLMAIVYFYHLCVLTGKHSNESPVFVDIEMFEDLLEPFILQLLVKSGVDKSGSELMELVSGAVYDILTSDFIYAPFKSNEVVDGQTKKYVCLSPDFGYVIENNLIPEIGELKILQGEVANSIKVDTIELLVDEAGEDNVGNETISIKINLKSEHIDKESDKGKDFTQIIITPYELANIYIDTEILGKTVQDSMAMLWLTKVSENVKNRVLDTEEKVKKLLEGI